MSFNHLYPKTFLNFEIMNCIKFLKFLLQQDWRGHLSVGALVRWGTCPSGHLSVGALVRGELVRWGTCPLGHLSGGNLSALALVRGELVRPGTCPGGTCPPGTCPGGTCPGGTCLLADCNTIILTSDAHSIWSVAIHITLSISSKTFLPCPLPNFMH